MIVNGGGGEGVSIGAPPVLEKPSGRVSTPKTNQGLTTQNRGGKKQPPHPPHTTLSACARGFLFEGRLFMLIDPANTIRAITLFYIKRKFTISDINKYHSSRENFV